MSRGIGAALYRSQRRRCALPRGRCSLLGPDLHRLDRTSLRLAQSFNHLVGTGEQQWRHGEAERLGGLQIKDELELGSLNDRQVRRLFSIKNAAGINANLSSLISSAYSVAH